MKRIQITLDEALLAQVDEAAQQLDITREAFIRTALGQAVAHYRQHQLEKQDSIGYQRFPAKLVETTEWAAEQVWESEWRGEK